MMHILREHNVLARSISKSISDVKLVDNMTVDEFYSTLETEVELSERQAAELEKVKSKQK